MSRLQAGLFGLLTIGVLAVSLPTWYRYTEIRTGRAPGIFEVAHSVNAWSEYPLWSWAAGLGALAAFAGLIATTASPGLARGLRIGGLSCAGVALAAWLRQDWLLNHPSRSGRHFIVIVEYSTFVEHQSQTGMTMLGLLAVALISVVLISLAISLWTARTLPK